MIKSILGGKSKNLFDISKVVTSNGVKRNGNSLICSSYGTSIGTLGSICPTLKPSDLITISFKCASEGAPSNFMAFGGRTFQSGATFLVSEIGLSTPWYLYSTDWEHRDIPNKTTYSDIQLELGSTATEYVPHGLTSYKSIMKVSDVMQVVDKPVSSTGVSLVGTSQTKSGITCHYLEDGTGVTLTGTTSTAIATFEFGVYKKPIIGHKYLWFYQHSNASDVINNAYIELKYIDKDGKGHWFNGTEQVYTLSEYAEKFEFHTIVKVNTTCNGFTFKPQLFDLTEMFGAGNEPKTVAEFKAKFPNDYYPYSPSCFVTSFDERMPCKTKNLFNYKNSDSTAKTITSNGVTLSLKNDYFELYGTQQEDKYFECSLTQFNIPFTAGKTYVLSLDNAIPQVAVVYFNGFYNDDTKKQLNLLRVQGTNNNPLKTFTPTKDGYFSQIVVYSPKSLRFSGNYNMRVQIEENSRKTEYVPHNYV